MTQSYYSPYPQPENPYPPSKTMAGWALGLAIFACVPLAWPVSIGLAIAVLVRSTPRRDHGRSLAIAALVIDALWLLGFLGLVAWSVVSAPETAGLLDDDGTVEVTDLGKGDCFNSPELSDPNVGPEQSLSIDRVEVIGCAKPHDFEVYLRQQVPGSEWPGLRPVVREVQEFCVEGFGDFVGKEYDRSELGLVYFHPQPRGWALGDHDGVCAVGEVTGKPVRGTLAHANR